AGPLVDLDDRRADALVAGGVLRLDRQAVAAVRKQGGVQQVGREVEQVAPRLAPVELPEDSGEVLLGAGRVHGAELKTERLAVAEVGRRVTDDVAPAPGGERP